ncbi:MAG: Pyruvate carboxylase subunit B [Candidatus Methanofastidiosum methylothiophilum]|uniref:Pyruvate carboxylase subunit B n=1 Tax=Candidatus Methanofastidiosum methylothiophilum TaxID=1705564 RepID=A0A150IM58_9EURY|nr:MAG: Pyruvate carboxylase subunit B [Candidatus Methanofastidiosum methylthiophilus]KYC48317.1 MAG: Pyruvate carboxylase subunit B [Candidatus Methanofastidiosum methylthiophilus]KYC50986.1 MAG: Pyruvate carboxylase subunit B [Candidatus Methanofastidiosum methylthiophilus]
MPERILRAPIPGIVQSIVVKEGQNVKFGETVVFINVMKMENPVAANANGKIKKVLVKEWDEIHYGDPLFIIEEK